MPAKGSAEWQGDLPTGKGTFTAGDTMSGEFSAKTRFEDAPGANPEQLIAGAHASCFSMAFANELDGAGFTADSVKTDAKVTIRLLEDEGPTITGIELKSVAVVPGIDEVKFQEIAAAAKTGCPVSKALAGVPEISLEAALQS